MGQDGKPKSGSGGGVGRLLSREELIAGHKEDGRTVYRRDAKARLVAAAAQPGASVARIARDHELNANQLHAWIRQSLRGTKARPASKVSAGMEKAAMDRCEVTSAQSVAKLVPVLLTPESSSALTSSSELIAPPTPTSPPAQAGLAVEIGGARIVFQGSVDRTALSAVLDCLRESRSR